MNWAKELTKHALYFACSLATVAVDAAASAAAAAAVRFGKLCLIISSTLRAQETRRLTQNAF